MTLSLIIISITSILIFYLLYRVYKYEKNARKIKNKKISQIKKISNDIIDTLNEKNDKEYYPKMSFIIERDVKTILKNGNIKSKLLSIDDLYCDFLRDIRSIEDFENFKSKLKNRKQFKTIFDKSFNILKMLKKEYSNEIVNSYIINFKSNYNDYKKDISKIYKNIKELDLLLNEFDMKSFNEKFKITKKLYNKILIDLNEPYRLKDKFLLSEDNIDQLEMELINKKGTLYHKVFNNIKKYKISKSETTEWNRIKRDINKFRKNKSISKDIIDLNNDLNLIINDLSNLNDKIIKMEESNLTNKYNHPNKIK